MLERVLRFEDFEDKISQTFTINEDGFPATALTLTEAELLPPRVTPGGRPPFSLIFVAKDDRVLPQRLYRIEQAGLGTIALFLVPVGRDAAGVQYQALFN
jgi:hypothetical protein